MIINRKHAFQAAIIVFVSAFLMAVFFLAIRNDLENDHLTYVYCGCEDSVIAVKWKLPVFNRASGIRINIEGAGVSEEVLISPMNSSYFFSGGIHGEKYKVTVREKYKNGTEGEVFEREVLCFEEDKIPDLPVIRIETVNHEEPFSRSVESPGDLWGETVIDNEYVDGVMKYSADASTEIDKRIRIRVRGNTSSVGPKKSYKITLNKPVDMLQMGEEYASEEWLLIDQGESLNGYIGEFLSEYCGMNWTVRMKLVNVIINGDWRGLYYLSENPKQELSGGLIGRNGFMVENDPYWWKPGTAYFDIEEQYSPMKITFVYPDNMVPDDERISPVRDYMQFVHTKIYSEEEDALSYIDTGSFVSWIMVKDLMLIMDGGGSNIYYYTESLDAQDYGNNILYIGPLWDMDSGMKASMSKADPETYWSYQHFANWYIYSHLFAIPEFRNAYSDAWKSVSADLADDLDRELESYYSQCGEAVESSRILESARWGTDTVTLREEIDFDKEFIGKRIAFIDQEVGKW